MDIPFTKPAINYYVEDVENVARFYTQYLGFVETFRTPEESTPVHLEVKMGTFSLGFTSKEARQSMHGIPLRSLGSPRCELVVWTDDVDKAYVALIEKGVPGVSPPQDLFGTIRAAWVVDPEGNPVEIASHQIN